jgi:hypothetical protein
MSAEIEVVHVF